MILMPTNMDGTADRNASAPRFWLMRVACGCLIGAAMATLDVVYYLPLLPPPNQIDFGLFLSSLTLWCGEWVLLALALGVAEQVANPYEWRTWQLGLALVVAVTACVILCHAFAILVLRDHFGMRLFREHIGQSDNWIGGILYHVWLMLFFGALIAAVVVSQRWRERMLFALRSTELKRATSQQRLAEARLASLEARVDPDYLHQTLSRLERLYEDDPAAADRLLDELITFLRNALNQNRAFQPKEAP